MKRFQGLNLKGDITENEYVEFKNLINDNKQSLLNDNENIKEKILELLNKK